MKKIFIILFPVLALVTGCVENITPKITPYESKLAVYCILMPDSTSMLSLTKSRPVFNYADTSADPYVVKDAQVIITDLTDNIKDTLKGQQVNLIGIPEYRYVGSRKIMTGHSYMLDAISGDKHVTGQTKVLQPVSLDSVSYVLESGRNTDFYRFKAAFTDRSGEEDAYMLNDFPGWRSQGQMGFRGLEIISDNGYEGKAMSIERGIPSYDIPPFGSFYLDFALSTMTHETADYLNSIRQQQESGDNPFTEPVIIKNNITNGLGVFGAISPSQRKRITVVR